MTGLSLDGKYLFVSNLDKRDPALARLVLARDLYCCQCCYATKEIDDLEVHHIHPLFLGGVDEINNLITLCRYCHKGAPHDPDFFLEYQKQGGKRGQDCFVQYVYNSLPFDTKIEMIAGYWGIHLQRFENVLLKYQRQTMF